MNVVSDLTLYKKEEHLLNTVIYPALRNFPKSEKFALCQEIKQAFYNLMRYTLLANNVKSKRRLYQEEADAHLKLLLALFSVAKHQKYITVKKSAQIQTGLAELGRILGGWMRSN